MKKGRPILKGAFGRSLSASLAGARAGSAFALDGAMSKLTGREAGTSERAQREARKFVSELGKLKGSYVKIGQMLALVGEHFLPPVLTSALHELDAQTRPLDWSHIQPILNAQLGSRLRELEVETTAIAAASLAQVHRARIRKTGQEIVLKVQYPDLRTVIDNDFKSVVRMLTVAKWLPAGSDIEAWLESMREQLHSEVDYPREVAQAVAMSERVEGWNEARPANAAAIHVPEYLQRYCHDDILAMSYVDGVNVGAAEVAVLPQEQRNALAISQLSLFFEELFNWGAMQVDPNFGNYLVSPAEPSIYLLDFGSVLTLSSDFRLGMAAAIQAGLIEDHEGVIAALRQLGCLKSSASEEAQRSFAKFVEHVLEPLRGPSRLPEEYLSASGKYCWKRSGLLTRAGKRATGSAATKHFAIPSPEFSLIVRKLTGVFTFISVLGAEFNGADIIQPYLERGVRDLGHSS